MRSGSLRELFGKKSDPYAGADMVAAKRMGALLSFFGAACFVAILPFAPPTEAIGAWGWGLAGAFGSWATIRAVRLLRGKAAVTFNSLYVVSYLGVAQVALLVWLAGGVGAPYHEFYFLILVYTACLHPPRRVLPFVAVLSLAAVAPLAYDGWDQVAAARIALQVLLWTGLALVATAFIYRVRSQRIGLRAQGEQASRLARVDALTGLGNRRAFDEILELEMRRAREARWPLSLGVVDIDGFKAVNDTYGHLSGDECLRQVARVVSGVLREGDTCFRWGGDEIVVLLPRADRDEAERIAERLCEAVESECVGPSGDALAIRCGTSELTDDMTAAELLEAADLQLLVEKGKATAVRD